MTEMTLAPKAYLTIDDSTTSRTDDLTAWLAERNIPALFFCRGDNLEKNPGPAIRAIERGFVLGNHTYSHERASRKDLEWYINDIERTERLIDTFHRAANVSRPVKTFRPPHMNCGLAEWVLDYDAYPEPERVKLLAIFQEGLNVQSTARPTPADFEKRDRLEEYLTKEGYTQPFNNVSQNWYGHGEAAAAKRCLFTYSNCDWMVTARHRGKWPYKSVDDLKQRAVDDHNLLKSGNIGIVLAHDQEEIADVTIELLDDLHHRGLQFLSFQ